MYEPVLLRAVLGHNLQTLLRPELSYKGCFTASIIIYNTHTHIYVINNNYYPFVNYSYNKCATPIVVHRPSCDVHYHNHVFLDIVQHSSLYKNSKKLLE